MAATFTAYLGLRFRRYATTLDAERGRMASCNAEELTMDARVLDCTKYGANESSFVMAE
jgi:hypothetical protein